MRRVATAEVSSRSLDLEPFAPPEESSGEAQSGAAVIATWAVAGACVGTSIGAMLELFGGWQTIAPLGLGSAALSGILGFVAFRVERNGAKKRPALVDGRGRLVRPMAPWLLGLPIGVAGVALLALVAVWSLQRGTTTPLVGFLVTLGGMALLARPLLGSQALTRAVEAVEVGNLSDAKQRLASIDAAIWPTRAVRAHARLNLGLLCLREGNLDEAAGWYESAGAGAGRALASTGLAFVRVLQDRWTEAEKLLHDAAATSEGRSAQAEIDGVRLLLILRRDGADDAVKLGERLVGPGAGSLFLAVLAAARQKTGDVDGANQLLADEAVQATLESGVAKVVPELQELRFGQ